VNYDPLVDAAKNMHLVEWGVKNRGWTRVDELINGFISDIDNASGGMVKYEVVEQIVLDEFPIQKDGFQYTASDFLNMYTNDMSKYHQPNEVDYDKIIANLDIVGRINRGEIDEVWLFGPPFGGFYQSVMAGDGAYWMGAPPLENVNTSRRFPIMGFSYERGVGEMLEDFGHRAENTLAHIFHAEEFLNWTYNLKRDPKEFDPVEYAKSNLLGRFLLYDLIAPGNANVGNLHFAPNSAKDYDWGNSTPVVTAADDWLLFPNLPDPPNFQMQNAASWGDGDIRAHHKWWFQRFPKAEGATNGISNNWWKFVIDLNAEE
jgi:hypothetical protein